MKEFRQLGGKPVREKFKELCFCILTANYSAGRAIAIQEAVGDGFLTLSERELAGKLKKLGHRYPNARAKYIVEARGRRDAIGKALACLRGSELRDWLVENIRGLGMKEASHFLRNIGYDDYAIIDYHIIDVLVKHGLAAKPKTMTKREYLELERRLRGIAGKLDMTLAELDLYMWYTETGRVLK